ncbi:IS21-like element helper ATPase IstB [Amycolatopsis sp. CA-161197]|uniref:IS21-like element helper ATPase IstB n=1 Tax=Amycolatopsis sp. CA-161197 TaxID=3239922 RepID=UPI003D90445C
MATTKATAETSGRNIAGEIAYLTRALKAPSLSQAVERLAERARAENWTHEEFLAACLQREVAARESHGGEGRIRSAQSLARKSLEEFDFDHQRSLKRDTITHLGTLDFITANENVVFLGPPGTGKTHLSIGLGMRACQAGHRVAFATAAEWVARLADAHHAGKLQAELVKLGRIRLLIVDEVGYIPFEAEAANLFFQLVSSRYERASLIVTSNKPFGRWGEVFGDDVVAAAMLDRLVHHAEVISMKGDSYRLKDRDLGRVPPPTKANDKQRTNRGSVFIRPHGVQIQPPLTRGTSVALPHDQCPLAKPRFQLVSVSHQREFLPGVRPHVGEC